MLALAAALLLAATPAPAKKAVDAPIAVMPFKNLNTDASLEWMKAGIAETMISDLKKSGKTRVVERDQVDHALTEVVLQGARDTEDSTAAKVGKLVGAKTIVVGSFQKAGKQLRINARFVSVETGEVLDTAKTTGAASDPFALQDQIVAQLLGVAPPSLPKRKTATPKTTDAYRLYAMSLTVASDAERAGYLQQSLAIDPDFVYSSDALEALKKRMGLYQQASNKALTAEQEALRAKFRDTSLPAAERARAGGKLEDSLLNSNRFHTLVAVAGEVFDAKLPGDGLPVDPTIYAAYCRIMALHRLRQWDQALQYGEAFLKAFPGGWGYDNVERTMQSIISNRQDEAKNHAIWEKHVAEETARLGSAPEKAELRDYAACQWAERDHVDSEMAASCSAFVDKYRDAKSAGSKARLDDAAFHAFVGNSSLGKFDEARRYAKRLENDPDWADTVATLTKANFPTD